MPCLRQDLPLRILNDDAERILLDFNATKIRLVCDKTLFSFKRLAKHHILLIRALRIDGCCQHPDPGRSRRDPLNLDLQLRIILIRCIGEVEHLHPHRPVAIEVESLPRAHPITFPLHQSLTLRSIETHETISKKIRVRQVVEICRHIFLHTLQVLHTRIGLYLRHRYQRTTDYTD